MTRPLLLSVSLLMIGIFMPVQALPVTTRYFEVNSFDEFNQGELEFAVISSRGEIHPGLASKEWEADVEGIWDILMLSSQDLLLATGNEGKILRFHNNKFSEEFDTDKVAITAITRGQKGVVYFAAIPDAAIYKRDGAGRISEFAKLEDDYAWSLVYDPSRGLVVGTGPEGKILQINSKGEVKELLDTNAEHVMCLLLKKGVLYAGTANPGMLLRISANGTYFVEHSFDEEEVRRVIDLSVAGDEILAVAVNSQRVPGPRIPSGPPMMPKGGKPGEENEDGEDKENESFPAVKKKPPGPRAPGKLNSAVYEIRRGKALRNILTLKGAAILDLVHDGKGNIYASTDQQGKVYMIEGKDHAYEVAFDFKAEQVLCMDTGGKGLVWMGTGMPGGLEKASGNKAEKAAYFSEVFDADFPAKWGRILHEPEGRLVNFKTRSGNTEEPDESWSKWEAVSLDKPHQIKSPQARYLQIKVSWPPLGKDSLSSFRAAYTILNQPHYIKEVAVLAPGQKSSRLKSRAPNKTNSKLPSSRSSRAFGPTSKKEASRDSKRTITWKVDNPDRDQLVFELFFKPESQKLWIQFPLEEELLKTRYEWETESIPDGFYRVRVRASDSRSNQPGQEYISERESDPFLVDNRRPEITDLDVSSRGRVSGKAKDGMSHIMRFEYSLDGGDWVFFMPRDRVFDEKSESFEFELEPRPEPGLHIISVRAVDASENLGAKHKEFTIK